MIQEVVAKHIDLAAVVGGSTPVAVLKPKAQAVAEES
jgi:hypothetical protein